MNKLKMMVAMLIFGTIGIFVYNIPLSSSMIVCTRAVIGSIFLFIVLMAGGKKIKKQSVKKNFWLLIFSGVALALNWIFLFEAYKYTGVPVATLCYYMAPVFVILVSPFVLKERLTTTNIICTAAAVVGAILISGVTGENGANLTGILLGLMGAVLYCSIVVENKLMRDISGVERAFIQMFIAAVVMIPYALLGGISEFSGLSAVSWVLLIVVGIVHTGLAYLLYFSSVPGVSAQTAAVLSYIDPVSTLILSWLVLSQPMSLIQICGAVLILASTLINELIGARK